VENSDQLFSEGRTKLCSLESRIFCVLMSLLVRIFPVLLLFNPEAKASAQICHSVIFFHSIVLGAPCLL
jgi:hypothetical protein